MKDSRYADSVQSILGTGCRCSVGQRSIAQVAYGLRGPGRLPSHVKLLTPLWELFSARRPRGHDLRKCSTDQPRATLIHREGEAFARDEIRKALKDLVTVRFGSTSGVCSRAIPSLTVSLEHYLNNLAAFLPDAEGGLVSQSVARLGKVEPDRGMRPLRGLIACRHTSIRRWTAMVRAHSRSSMSSLSAWSSWASNSAAISPA